MDDPIEVLVIDDEQIVCERLQPMLEKSGFLVETFTDSQAAMARLAEKKFDILITDLKMAPPDGTQLLDYAREHAPEMRVVVITGFATAETARQAMKGGAVDFIAKPFRLSYLRDLMLKIASEIRGRSEPAS